MDEKMKTCVKCKETKPMSAYRQHGRGCCKECTNKKIAEKPRQDPVMIGDKRCSICKNVKSVLEFDIRKLSKDGRCAKCKTCTSEDHSEYYQEHREEIIVKTTTHFNNNRESAMAQRLIHQKEREESDPCFKLARRMRARLWKVLNDQATIETTFELVGCTVEELKVYLEKQFQPGMSWDNYGEWHVDHVKALANFDLTDVNQRLIACHYTNLQPLWAIENIKKGAK